MHRSQRARRPSPSVPPRLSKTKATTVRAGQTEALEPIRVIVADDQPIIRAGLRQLLEAQADIRVEGEAGTADEVIALCAANTADVLLLSAGLGGDGTRVLEKLDLRQSALRVLLVATKDRAVDLVQVLRLGAYGVVMKDTSPPLLYKSIRCVRAGEFWVGREMVASLVAALVLGRRASAPQTFREGASFKLTPREHEIVASVASGYTNRQMASRLGIAEDTIKHHLTNIFNKTGASNRLELALFAIHYGLHQPHA